VSRRYLAFEWVESGTGAVIDTVAILTDQHDALARQSGGGFAAGSLYEPPGAASGSTLAAALVIVVAAGAAAAAWSRYRRTLPEGTPLAVALAGVCAALHRLLAAAIAGGARTLRAE
jgi:hypothetical protein